MEPNGDPRNGCFYERKVASLRSAFTSLLHPSEPKPGAGNPGSRRDDRAYRAVYGTTKVVPSRVADVRDDAFSLELVRSSEMRLLFQLHAAHDFLHVDAV
jgi:hypothetical protein